MTNFTVITYASSTVSTVLAEIEPCGNVTPVIIAEEASDLFSQLTDCIDELENSQGIKFPTHELSPADVYETLRESGQDVAYDELSAANLFDAYSIKRAAELTGASA